MDEHLLSNLHRLHTTPLGEERIRRNLEMPNGDIVSLCKTIFLDDNNIIERRGKNWYVTYGRSIWTVNASSFTIITAHRTK